MSDAMVVVLAILVFVAVTIAKGVRIVPQCDRLLEGDRSGEGGVWRDRFLRGDPQHDHDHAAFDHRRDGTG